MLLLSLSLGLVAQLPETPPQTPKLIFTQQWQEPVLTRRDFTAALQGSALKGEELRALKRSMAREELTQSLPVLPVSQDDLDKMAQAWASDSRLLWSGTSLGKKPDLLEPLLNAAYVEEQESFKMDLVELVAPPKTFLQSDIRLDRLALLISAFTPYEFEKNVRGGEGEEAKTFFESAGFAVLENAKTQKQCSLPVVGQSLKGVHHIFVGFRADQATSFVSAFEEKEKVFSSSVLVNPGLPKIFVFKLGDLDQVCEWKDPQVVSITKESVQSISMNYSINRFLGLRLNDPLNAEGAKAYLVQQTPSVRRGLWSGCHASEDQNWLAFSTSSDRPAIGGRFYLDEANDLGRIRVTTAGAQAGAEINWNLPESKADFTIYLWSNQKKRKTLALTPPFTKEEGPFVKWISKQIPNDPY